MSNISNKIVNESFGSWLNQARQWASGVGQGALSGTVFDKGDKQDYNARVQDQLQRAEILQSAIFDAGNTIDSVLNSLEGTDLQKKAKNAASDMISFLQQSIKTVQSIISEGGQGDMTNKSSYANNGGLDPGRKKQLDDVAAGLDRITQRSGSSKGYENSPLDTWCREFLGKHNENFESNEYLSTGNSLVAKAQSIINEIRNAAEVDRKIAEKDVDKVISKGLKQLQRFIGGKSDTQAILVPKPGSQLEELINRNSNKPQSAAVQKFREDLRKLNIQTSTEDVWSEKDDPCAEEAATVVSAITKKKYEPKEKEGFKELQRDVKTLVKNQPKIKEILTQKPPKI
jgi:hypothetical protein